MARQDEFNRDMDDYLRGRRVVQRTNPLTAARNYFKTLFAVKEQKKEELPLDIPPEQVQAVLAQSAVKPQARPAQSTPTQAKPKVNTMGWFSKKKEEDYEMVEAAQVAAAAPALDEETKEVLKITFKWLKMMDPETIDEIKRSPDFEKYKRVLDKYGLIKK